jgi:high-affinity K+ transport system ATPase subunit B
MSTLTMRNMKKLLQQFQNNRKISNFVAIIFSLVPKNITALHICLASQIGVAALHRWNQLSVKNGIDFLLIVAG